MADLRRATLETAEDIAAIRGDLIPNNLDRHRARLCLIHGIRYNDGFAQELREAHPEYPKITRALNAREIMSNRLPDMANQEEFPYCFWYPDVPSEETLRQLLKRYPENILLRYQVGRACAVGCYTTLYSELQILPDVAIAEEARDSGSGKAIYELIMRAPIQYFYMDDYNRCLQETPVAGAFLNGDTCVRSILDKKQLVSATRFGVLSQPSFDITEDWSVDVEGLPLGDHPVDPIAISLLHSPLPPDLPTVDKDLLIAMAAWTGNIDRYARLHRPVWVLGERACVLRGIYHHPLFAKWITTHLRGDAWDSFFRAAIHARCIMSNDLSWLTDDGVPENELPELIWYPQHAHQSTYEELARRRPCMKPQISRACIHADYEELFDKLDTTPDAFLWGDAKKGTNQHYAKQIARKAREMAIDLEELDQKLLEEGYYDGPFTGSIASVLQQEFANGCDYTQTLSLKREITLNDLGFEDQDAAKSGPIGRVLLHASVADPSIRPCAPYDSLDLLEVYQDDPYIESEQGRRMVGLRPNLQRPRGGYRGRGGDRADRVSLLISTT